MERTLDYQRAFSTMTILAEIKAEQTCMIREAKRARIDLHARRARPSILDWLFRRNPKHKA